MGGELGTEAAEQGPSTVGGSRQWREAKDETENVPPLARARTDRIGLQALFADLYSVCPLGRLLHTRSVNGPVWRWPALLPLPPRTNSARSRSPRRSGEEVPPRYSPHRAATEGSTDSGSLDLQRGKGQYQKSTSGTLERTSRSILVWGTRGEEDIRIRRFEYHSDQPVPKR